jgi:hypothetical protein
MNTMVLRAAMLVVLLIAPVAAHAQAPEPGQRVRVRLIAQPRAIEGAAPRQLLRGTLVGVTTDSLLLQLHPASDVTAIARAGIDRLYVSHGVRGRLESALVHGATGAITGAIQRTLFRTIDHDHAHEESTAESALIGAAFGAAIGITIGAIFPQERWQRLRSW